MKRLTLGGIAAIVLFIVMNNSSRATDQCYTCHRNLGDAPSSLFAHDIHRLKGITCAGCHGGNPASEDMEAAMDTAAGFIGAPKGNAISAACAACHSDSMRMKQFGSTLPTGQWESLRSSVHGAMSVKGGEQIAQCITCHTAHGILPVKDRLSPVNPLNVVATCAKCHANASYMRDYSPSIAVDQVEKYRTSVHGMRNARGDGKTAQCASCHGSHNILSAKDVKSSVYAENLPTTCARCHSNAEYMREYGLPTDQFAKFSRSVHGRALLEKHDRGAPACNDCHGNHGAAPPGLESVSKVCGTCHALNADLFSSSPHKKAFDERKLPECETCHGNHEIVAATEQLLGISKVAVCSKCHQPDTLKKGYVVAASMRMLIDSLDSSMQRASLLIDEAEQKGMEVSEAKYRLRDAHQARLQSRTMVHSFDEIKFRGVVEKGLVVTSAVTQEAQDAIHEYYFRRWGLGISTLIISVVVVALYLTLRRIERRQSQS